MSQAHEPQVIPLVHEVAAVSKETIQNRVVVQTTSVTHKEVVHEILHGERVEITRVPVGREVDGPPAVRTEEDGALVIVPVLEERLTIVKTLILTEELHIRRQLKTETLEVPVTLRKQQATVTRTHADNSTRTRPDMDINRQITAFFDRRAEADAAIQRLVQAGVPRTDISLVEGSNTSSAQAAPRGSTNNAYDASRPKTSTAAGLSAGAGDMSSSPSYEGEGFWASLSRLFMPDEDRYTYAEGLRRGGYLVSVQVSDALHDRALDILDDEGTINVDERAQSWRSEGWQGYRSETQPNTSGIGSGASTTAGTASASGMAPVSQSRAPSSAATRAATGLAVPRDQVIPVTEEQLNISKRAEIGGRVRVRSYVRETPVQEQVNLRQENVSIERRPVDRAAGAGDFQDRTIEATESSERAVVNKQARVVEEVVLNKNVESRTETVRDTVRKTEVQVEDERAGKGTGTNAPGSRKPV